MPCAKRDCQNSRICVLCDRLRRKLMFRQVLKPLAEDNRSTFAKGALVHFSHIIDNRPVLLTNAGFHARNYLTAWRRVLNRQVLRSGNHRQRGQPWFNATTPHMQHVFKAFLMITAVSAASSAPRKPTSSPANVCTRG